GKIILTDIELDLQVLQVSERHHIPLSAALAHKASGYELPIFYIALQNRPRHWRLDHGVLELRLRIRHLSPSLLYLPAQAVYLLLPWSKAYQSIYLLECLHARCEAVIAGLRIIQRHPRHQAFGYELLSTLQ